MVIFGKIKEWAEESIHCGLHNVKYFIKKIFFKIMAKTLIDLGCGYMGGYLLFFVFDAWFFS